MSRDQRTVLVANPGADLYGSDRMAVETVRALVAAGLTVFVSVPAPGPLTLLMKDAGATVLELPTPILRKSLASPRGLLRLGREAVSALVPSWRLLRGTNAGTVVVNTITAPLWFPVGRLAGCRVVCHVHEAEGSAPPLVRRLLYAPLVFCHRIIINSRFSLDVLALAAPWLRGRTAIIYNAVAGPERVVPPRSSLEGAVRLLYVGRLSHRKGPHVVVDALRLLKERGQVAHLGLLGAVFPGNEAYEQSLRDRVRDLGLEEDVTFLGFRPGIWEDMASSDIVVIPSTVDEPFGNTAVEASRAARPFVVSDIAGLREASAAAGARVAVPPSDPAALADAVERIVDEWPRYRDRARQDAVTVADRFSSRRYAAALLQELGVLGPGESEAQARSSARSRRYHTRSTRAVYAALATARNRYTHRKATGAASSRKVRQSSP